MMPRKAWRQCNGCGAIKHTSGKSCTVRFRDGDHIVWQHCGTRRVIRDPEEMARLRREAETSPDDEGV